MTDHLLHGRLLNSGGELVAEGPCWLDEPSGLATLEPEREPGVIQKERGRMSLELDNGRTLDVADQPMVFHLGTPTEDNARNGHRSIYRLRINSAQDAEAVGAVEEGPTTAPMPSERLRNGETPAAR